MNTLRKILSSHHVGTGTKASPPSTLPKEIWVAVETGERVRALTILEMCSLDVGLELMKASLQEFCFPLSRGGMTKQL